MNLDPLLFRNSFYDVFGFSTRSLGHVMFSFAGTAQKAGAGGRSGAVGIPVRDLPPAPAFWAVPANENIT